MIFPPGLFDRANVLRKAKYTGSMTLNWKDGYIVDWSFTVRERGSEVPSEKSNSSSEQEKKKTVAW